MKLLYDGKKLTKREHEILAYAWVFGFVVGAVFGAILYWALFGV